LMFITSFGEQNITYKCCSNFLIHLYTKTEDGTYYLPIEGIKPYAEQANFKNNHAIAYGLKFGYWF
ncbi:hypothetical protein ABTH62_15485, partial [Acinetobacter baumannii]